MKSRPIDIEMDATRFSAVGLPVLSKGRHTEVFDIDGDLSVIVKIYAEGGENALHAHTNEDHLFFILGGIAEFAVGCEGDKVTIAEQYDGVYLPRGCFYRFRSAGTENLVMLRVGSRVRRGTEREVPERIAPNGSALAGRSRENYHEEAVTVPGRAFLR